MENYLDKWVRDTVSDFEGRVTAVSKTITGRELVMIENVDSTGRPIEHWIDVERIEVQQSTN